MTIIFFFKCFKFDVDSRNAKKKIEKIFVRFLVQLAKSFCKSIYLRMMEKHEKVLSSVDCQSLF